MTVCVVMCRCRGPSAGLCRTRTLFRPGIEGVCPRAVYVALAARPRAMASTRGFVFMVVLFVMSLLYSLILLAPSTLLLAPLSPPGLYSHTRRAYRRWVGFVGYLFFAAAAFLLEHFCGTKVRKDLNYFVLVVGHTSV